MGTIRFHPDKYNLDDDVLEDLYSVMDDWRFIMIDLLITIGLITLFIKLV